MATRPYYSSAPGDDSAAVTPSDSADLPMKNGVWPVLYITAAGDVAHITAAGTTHTLALPAGLWLVRTRRVLSTGTTATGIIAIY